MTQIWPKFFDSKYGAEARFGSLKMAQKIFARHRKGSKHGQPAGRTRDPAFLTLPFIERIFPDAEESFGVFVNGIEISALQRNPPKHQPDGSEAGGKLEVETVDVSSPGVEDIHQPCLALVPGRSDDPESVTGDKDLADVVIELLGRRPVVVRALLARIRRPLDLVVLPRDRLLDFVRFGVEVVDPVVDAVNDVDGIQLLTLSGQGAIFPR